MAYVQIPRDLNKVKEKFLFGLTKRQVLWFGMGIAVGLIPFFILVSASITSAVVTLFFCVVPFGFMGMYEKNGLTCDKLITNWLKANFLRSKLRLYKTENIYVDMEEQLFVERWAKRVGYKKSVKDKIAAAIESGAKLKQKKRR